MILSLSVISWRLRNASTTASMMSTWWLVRFGWVRRWRSWIATFFTSVSCLATSAFAISVSGISSVLSISWWRSRFSFTRFFNWWWGARMTSVAQTFCWKTKLNNEFKIEICKDIWVLNLNFMHQKSKQIFRIFSVSFFYYQTVLIAWKLFITCIFFDILFQLFVFKTPSKINFYTKI